MLPHFLIIGARKSGTTSLYEYLAEHPRVAPALHKEVYFFDLHFARGLDWYRAHFPTAAPGKLTGEATPGYLFDPVVAERVREALPEVRLFALLRNPVDRAVSEFHHVRGRGNETRSLEQAVEEELAWLRDGGGARFERGRQPYLWKGLYADRLAPWLGLFPRGQLHLLTSEHFFADPAAEMRRAFAYLDLEPRIAPSYKQYIPGSYSRLDPALRERLTEFYAPHNRRLAELLGRELPWA
jgi:hypothetical protein